MGPNIKSSKGIWRAQCTRAAQEVEIKAWRFQNGTEHEGTRRGRCSRNAAENPIADKEYDNESIVEFAVKNGINAVIPSLSNAIMQKIYDKELYKKRHIVENFFPKEIQKYIAAV